MKLVGTAEMKGNLLELARRSRKAIERGVKEFAEVEMTEMKKNVPVDTGTLKSSGYVDAPKREGNTVSIELGFGGAAEDYAIPVHEDMEAFHRVGGPKYVERPLAQSAPHFADRVGASVKDDLGL